MSDSRELHSLDLDATLGRMEPGVSTPCLEQSMASIAISLKRVADTLDLMTSLQSSNAASASVLVMKLDEIKSAIYQHSQRAILVQDMK